MTPSEKVDELIQVAKRATQGKWWLDHDDTYVGAPIPGESHDWYWITGGMQSKDNGYDYCSSDEEIRGPKSVIQENCRFIFTFNPERMRKILEAYREMMEVITRETNAHPPDQACHLCKVLSAAEEALEME